MLEGIAAILGSVFGSFTNMLIDRIPRGESIVWKPSHCDHCRRNLRWFELIPIISYVVIGGACLRCKKPLPWEYPVVELFAALGFVGAWVGSSGNPMLFLALGALWVASLAIGVIDMRHQIIPDSLLILMLGAIFLILGAYGQDTVVAHLLTAAVSGLFFLALFLITRGRGLGFGDVKLSFVIGLLLGYPHAVVAFYISFLTGAIVGVILIAGRRAHMKTRIAFGPFLLIGMWVSWVWGTVIVQSVLRVL